MVQLEELVGRVLSANFLHTGARDYSPIVRIGGFSAPIFVKPKTEDPLYMEYYNSKLMEFEEKRGEEGIEVKIELIETRKDRKGNTIGIAYFVLPEF